MEGQSNDPCGPDCWLKQEGPTPCERRIDDYGAAAHFTESQRLLQPLDAAKYLYVPIYPWQMRLIRLEPGSFQDALRCTLHTADIVAFEGIGVSDYGTIVDHLALSYHWGDKHVFTHPLHCGDMIVSITANLASALHHIRLADKPCFLWIDALCIDQYNHFEKGQQAQNMLPSSKRPSVYSHGWGYKDPGPTLHSRL